jgi:NADH:ubiquinone oxidoreductase subunit B-like Fe-S oxidoreductase
MLLVGSIKHADVLLVTGAVNRQCIPRIKRLYEQMPKPRLVVAIGECALSRGVFMHSYNCPQPLDHVIPVDVYIPGCPPRPEAIISGIMKLVEQRKAQTDEAKA